MENTNETITTNKKIPASSLAGWLIICVGIILSSLSLTGLIGKGGVGEFITYVFAYLFGVLYPFALVFLVVLGVRLIVSRRLFTFKNYRLLMVGLILICVSVLAFSSYSVYTSIEGGLNLVSLNSFYSNRMLSFARSPIEITSYEALGGLGGGYLGLFLLSLLGSMWTSVGNVVFFSIVLVLGVFFALFKPVSFIVGYFIKKHREAVKYSSPYKPKKDKSNPHLERRIAGETPYDDPVESKVNIPQAPFVPSQQATAPFGDAWKNDGPVSPSKPSSPFGSTSYQPEEPKAAMPESSPSSYRPPYNFRNDATVPSNEPFAPQPTYPQPNYSERNPYAPSSYSQPSVPESVPSSQQSSPFGQTSDPFSAPTSSFNSPSPMTNEPTSPFGSSDSSFESNLSSDTNAGAFQNPFGESSPFSSQPVNSETNDSFNPFSQPSEPETSYPSSFSTQNNQMRTEEYSQNNSDEPLPPMPTHFPSMDEVYGQKPSNSSMNNYSSAGTDQSTPLQRDYTVPVKENNTYPMNKPNNDYPFQPTNGNNTFPMNSSEEEKPVENEISEEERERRAIDDFFRKKQQEKAQAIAAKQRAKQEKLANLMRFVSDNPRIYQYRLPSIDMLSSIDDSNKMTTNIDSANEKASLLHQVFEDYKINAKIVNFTIGASVTRLNVEMAPGEKADKLTNHIVEFQKALNGDMSVRVETVVAGQTTSGIEVANKVSMAVSFKEMFAYIQENNSKPLVVPVGKDISGNIITYPLNEMPHMLIAGTTGSGKSVLIHSMIMTLMMRNYPSQLKLMLIDPKRVEFIRYADCSHLFCPVISEPESAVLALKKLCEEMDRRFDAFAKVRAANIEEYKSIVQGRMAYPEMPYVVCIIDEFADLMQTAGKEVPSYVQRIAQKARACGIHLIIATQRPSKESVPMTIKGNIPCRIGLSVSTRVDSQVILDEIGAETLLGRGDLLFKCPGIKSMTRAQSPFISNEEIDSVLSYIKSQAGDPSYNAEFLDLEKEQEEEEETTSEGDIYSQIKEFVIETKVTSKVALVKNFMISSAKADTFFARMMSEGVLIINADGKYILGPNAFLGDYR